MDHRAVAGTPGLPRVRLFDQLDAAVAGGPALVVAPAGFGKSTLLAQYAGWHAGPSAAYRADAMEVAHGDTAARLIEAVRAARRPPTGDPGGEGRPGTSGEARRLVAEARDQPTAVLEVMAAAAREPGGLLLTIDDFDHLIGTPGETVVAQVLARRPHNVRIVLSARRTPGMQLLRHELSGVGTVVGIDDLRFRRWEAERLLEQVYGEPLPPDCAAALTGSTGGWPAGLALFHRATRGLPMADRCRAAAAPHERWPAFRQYFDEVVLPGVPPQVLDLMVATSVLDVLTTDRCARLIGRPVPAAALENLIGTYALPLTAHGESYRYEPPFRAHLLARLADLLGRAGLRERHRRGAQVLLEDKAYPEAARSLARAGDWPDLRQLLAERGTAVVRPPVAALIALVPDELRAGEPWLVYADADDRLNNSRLPAARDRFQEAAAMFAARSGPGDDAGLRATGRKLREVESLLAKTLPGNGLYWTAWLRVAVGPHAIRNTRRVAELTRAEAELIRLVGAVYGGGVPEEIIRDTHTVGIDTSDSPVAVLGLRLVRTCIEAGRGRASPAALERIGDQAEAQGLGWVARLALGCRALGGAPYTADDTYAVAAACRQAGDRWGFLLLSSVGAICEARDGRLDEDRLATLRLEATDAGAESIAAWAESFGALAQARRNAPGAARAAQAAVDRAEAAGVAGAEVAGMLALAVADPARRPALLRAAGERAVAGDVRPAMLRFWLSRFATVAVVHRPPAARIRCFGGFEMAVSGRPLDLSRVRPRARSALRLLAVRAGRFVHREVLIEALWSDLTPASATRNLQVTISALRGLLEPQSGRGKAQILVRSGDSYGIVLTPGSDADTATFADAVQRWRQQRRSGDAAAEVEALRAAVAAYGGEVLPEEGPAEWAVEVRDHFRQLATRVTRELAIAELALDNVAAAIQAAEQCIAVDPHDDQAWQVLLRGHATNSNPAKAEDTRRRYATMLAQLGVAQPAPAVRGA